MVIKMMDCARFLDGYSDYRDGLLADDEGAEYLAHLAMCGSCARYDRVVRSGVAMLRELPELEPSEDFVLELKHRIFHEDDDRRRMQRRASGAATAVTGAIAASIALLAWVPAIGERGRSVVEMPPITALAPASVEAEMLPLPSFVDTQADWVDLMREPQPGFASLVRYEYAGTGFSNAEFVAPR
jgi:anti-sigma factor RsiW